jgi:hypothetical protein
MERNKKDQDQIKLKPNKLQRVNETTSWLLEKINKINNMTKMEEVEDPI